MTLETMEQQSSACAMYSCETCEHLASTECPGCRVGNAKLLQAGVEVCAVYACLESRKLTSCDECREPACVLKRSVETICPLRSQFEKKRWWAGRMSRALESRKPQGAAEEVEKISEKIVSRLRWYLSALDSFASEEADSVSSWQLAEKVGVNAALIRKDLSRFGEFGTPSSGYKIDFLRDRLRGILHLNTTRGIVWIGSKCYKLHACAMPRLESHNCHVVAVFDTDETEIGTQAGSLTVQSVDQLIQALQGLDVVVAAVAIPGPQAQVIAKTLVGLGVRAVLNLTGEMLVLPDHVRVSSFDIAGEVLELSYYCGR